MLNRKEAEFEFDSQVTFNAGSSDISLLEELTYLESLERCMFELASEEEMNQLTIVRSQSR